MNSRQKIIVTISVVIVAMLVVVGIATKKKNGTTKIEEGGEVIQKEGAIEGVFSPVIPKDIERATPIQTSPAREGSEETLGMFKIEMTMSGFSSRDITAKEGDIVQLLLEARDGTYDFEIPYIGMYKIIQKGEEGIISFEATDAGTLSFQCRDHCPASGGKGRIIIAPK